MGPGRHEQVRELIGRAFPSEQAPRAINLLEPFGPELQRYAEAVISPSEVAIGFMTRGEDASFSSRVARLLAELGAPAEALAHQHALATWFEHKRAFFKLEWLRDGAGVMVPRATTYFRRRPNVELAVEKLGLAPALREDVRGIARVLGKPTIHFVAAAFGRGRPVEHKLYFSQYAPAALRAETAGHIDELMARFGMTPAARARWRGLHGAMLPPGSPTFFASVVLGERALGPTLKLDYPGVTAERAAEWLDGEARGTAFALAARMCAMAGARALSYIGVRFTTGDDAVKLKFYTDLPE